MILDVQALYDSDRLERCSTRAAFAYPFILGVADDWGRAEWNPRKIFARCFPKRPTVREADVRAWLEEYERVRSPMDPEGQGLLTRYQVDGVAYFEWWAWKGSPPSKRRFMRCPPPPWADPSESKVWEKSRYQQIAKRRASRRIQVREKARVGTTAVPSVPAVHAGLLEVEEERASVTVPPGTSPPARSSPPLPDHDPAAPLEVRLAERCLALARRDVADQGREPTAAEVLEVLEAVSSTGNGQTIARIRGAPAGWIERTLEVCERFEREVFDGGDDPPKEE
jgi:hypothetical protein